MYYYINFHRTNSKIKCPSPLLYLWLMIPNVFAIHRTAIGEKVAHGEDKSPIAITAKSFVDLVTESNVFLDKSLLIKEIIEDENQTILITRPRYWGKTINLDMIKTFVNLPVDNAGKVIHQIEDTPQYSLFVKGEIVPLKGEKQKLKEPLLIAKEKHIIDKYLGRYPVIHVDFNDLNEENFSNAVNAIKTRISDAYRKHEYMVNVFDQILKNESALESVKNVAKKRLDFFNDILHKGQVSNDNLKESLTFLSEILHDHFKARVFIMMDEYDTPSNLPFVNFNFPENERENFFNFYTNFLLATFKKNKYLVKGILTGRFPLTKEDLDAGLNGVAEYTFLKEELMEYYGFEKSEISKISEILKSSINVTQTAGSSFYEFPNRKLFIYNPLLIANILAGNGFHSWFDIEALKTFLKFYISTNLRYFQTFNNGFQFDKFDMGFCGYGLWVGFLEGGHFSRDELEIHYKALKCEFTLPEYEEKLLKFKFWDYNKYLLASKDWFENGQPSAEASKFDYHKFLDKVWLFLYTQGYLSIYRDNHDIIRMGYALRDESEIQPISKFILINWNPMLGSMALS